jgi:hypothetical protein
MQSLQLTPRQLKEPLAINPEPTIRARIQARGPDISSFADRLGSADKLLKIFPDQVAEDHVHIIVQQPTSGEWIRLWSQSAFLLKPVLARSFPFSGLVIVSLHMLSLISHDRACFPFLFTLLRFLSLIPVAIDSTRTCWLVP